MNLKTFSTELIAAAVLFSCTLVPAAFAQSDEYDFGESNYQSGYGGSESFYQSGYETSYQDNQQDVSTGSPGDGLPEYIVETGATDNGWDIPPSITGFMQFDIGADTEGGLEKGNPDAGFTMSGGNENTTGSFMQGFDGAFGLADFDSASLFLPQNTPDSGIFGFTPDSNTSSWWSDTSGAFSLIPGADQFTAISFPEFPGLNFDSPFAGNNDSGVTGPATAFEIGDQDGVNAALNAQPPARELPENERYVPTHTPEESAKPFPGAYMDEKGNMVWLQPGEQMPSGARPATIGDLERWSNIAAPGPRFFRDTDGNYIRVDGINPYLPPGSTEVPSKRTCDENGEHCDYVPAPGANTSGYRTDTNQNVSWNDFTTFDGAVSATKQLWGNVTNSVGDFFTPDSADQGGLIFTQDSDKKTDDTTDSEVDPEYQKLWDKGAEMCKGNMDCIYRYKYCVIQDRMNRQMQEEARKKGFTDSVDNWQKIIDETEQSCQTPTS